MTTQATSVEQELMARWGVAAQIPGDTNNDGVVNDEDAATLADNWLTLTGATWEMGDFNGDGRVDDIDATLLATNWQAGSASASVPEPAALALLAGIMIAAVLCRRNRR